MKDIIQKIKELWQIPRGRALIKLGLYALFFAFVFIMLSFGGPIEPNKYEPDPVVNKIDYLEERNYDYTLIVDGEEYEGRSVEGNVILVPDKYIFLSNKYIKSMIEEGKLEKEINNISDSILEKEYSIVLEEYQGNMTVTYKNEILEKVEIILDGENELFSQLEIIYEW